MALLDRVKLRTGSDLPDGELQAMIDGITAELDARLGPAGPVTVEIGDLTDPYSTRLVTLRVARPIDQAEDVTIVETNPGNAGGVASITLYPADYAVLHGGRTIIRRATGPHPQIHWAPLVTVTYTPVGQQAARDEATIKLVHLDLSWRGGLKSEKAGDYQMTLGSDPAAEREAIIAGLEQQRGMVMA